MSLELLQNFQQKFSEIQPTLQKFTKKPVRLSSIQRNENNFTLQGSVLTEEAARDLVKILSIKRTLINEVSVDENLWHSLHQCLTNIKKDKVITAICFTESANDKHVVRFFDRPLTEDTNLDLQTGVSHLESYLETVSEDVKLQDITFNQKNLQIETRFLKDGDGVDVFNDNNDLWSTGFSVNFGEFKAQASPFFLRKLCTNGLTATHMSSQRYFENRVFKQTAFNKLLNKATQKDIEDIVRNSCNRLKQNKASLREFYKAREILSKESKELTDVYFNETEIIEAYNDKKIKTKNHRWLSTANSNINAYDFFNQITHCVSHQKLTDNSRIELNNVASEMFFKGPDFSYCAPNPFIK